MAAARSNWKSRCPHSDVFSCETEGFDFNVEKWACHNERDWLMDGCLDVIGWNGLGQAYVRTLRSLFFMIGFWYQNTKWWIFLCFFSIFCEIGAKYDHECDLKWLKGHFSLTLFTMIEGIWFKTWYLLCKLTYISILSMLATTFLMLFLNVTR